MRKCSIRLCSLSHGSDFLLSWLGHQFLNLFLLGEDHGQEQQNVHGASAMPDNALMQRPQLELVGHSIVSLFFPFNKLADLEMNTPQQ